MVASMRVSVLFLIGLVLASAVAADLPMAPLPRRLMAPIGYSNTNLAANTVRAQAQTSQAIEQAVNSGGSPGATRRAGVVGTTTSWAAGQRQDVFNTVERATAPNTFTNGH